MTEVEYKYYKTGELESEVLLINGMRNGCYKKYHTNGVLDNITYYTDSIGSDSEPNTYMLELRYIGGSWVV